MSDQTLTTRAYDIEFDFIPSLGILENLLIRDGDKAIRPLHRAPWVGSRKAMPRDAAPHMARLGGDFFCAPFGGSETSSPLHGWPPNSAWSVWPNADGALVANLDRLVMGARLQKRLALQDGHPFIYQSHTFSGGQGDVAVANHANVSLANGGLISTSRKQLWQTPDHPLEDDPQRGRSQLRYPATSQDFTHFPGLAGDIDLSSYPWGQHHEDFVIGFEETGHTLGWTAVVRPTQGDCFLSLRNATQLPMTMLWHSNGGRDYAPWNGRHFGCLGVEEGAAVSILGKNLVPTPLEPGMVTLGQETVVRHVIGAVGWPTGEQITHIENKGDCLFITGAQGAKRNVPFDSAFLNLSDSE